MTPEQAIEIIARHAVARAAENIADDGWELYPEIGEHDWERVGGQIRAMATYPVDAEYDEAYAVLTVLAEGGTR